jgi:5-methylcytosine-specific restriction endonuclease McrA
MSEFPVSYELSERDEYRSYCRWCGTELHDKRRRYCCEEHQQLWITNVRLREVFWYQRKKALERDQYECSHCGITQSEHQRKFRHGLHVHHIVPRCKGGSNYVENLLTLCRDCHTAVHSGGQR